ncbi:MAG: glycoside hydrolase family 38 C-terminal domain-containing protein [Terriglobia bacterium]
MIGNAHIDPVWLWTWDEGMSAVVSTFRSVLDRMNENPEFTFTASSAQFYEWVQMTDPKLMDEVRKRVAEGRWAVVGGWWIEPDVNIPNGESLVRQGLYGQQLFKQLFGKNVEIGYNPDSFGHPGTLPQILKLQGMRAYVFMRPQPKEKALPSDLFWWEGADSTRILAYHIPIAYGDYDGPIMNRVHRIVAELPEPTKNLMAFYGAGDHGGGPTKVNIQSILDARKEPGAPAMIFSTPYQYFEDVKDLPGLPVLADDLQHHSVGCYTAVSEVKKNNRAAEAALATAEKMALLSHVLAGFDYPQNDFAAAWKKVLFLQFHDSMAGSSLPAQYDIARAGHGYALEVANQAIVRAAQKLAWQIPAQDPNSEYLLVFNPHAWDANLNVEYEMGWEFSPVETKATIQRNSSLEDERGHAVNHQWVQASTVIDDRNTLVFRAPVPAFGYRQFRLRKVQPIPQPESLVHARENELENEHLLVKFSEDGSLSIFDKDEGAEVFQKGKGGARAIVLDDPSDTWSHDVRAYTKEVGSFGNARFRLMENGPLRAKIRVRTSYGASSMQTDWVLYAGARTVEAQVALDWHEQLKMLKFSFPVAVENALPTYEIAYGFKVRKAEGDEDPGQRWIDVTGQRRGGEYGLTVINDAKYGYSVKGSDMRVSVVRSPVFAQFERELKPDGEYLWQDQGRQTFRMLLVPHRGAWQDAGVVRMVEEFTAPVPVLYQGIHPGSRPPSASFLSVDVPDVVVSVVKKAEDGDDLIIRCYETAGRAVNATVNLGMVNRHWTGAFRPLEIKTLRVPRGDGDIREVNLLEQ